MYGKRFEKLFQKRPKIIQLTLGPGISFMDQRSNNKTQRLQQWFDERPRWDHASYGEFMHIGANQTIFRIALEEQEIGTETKAVSYTHLTLPTNA